MLKRRLKLLGKILLALIALFVGFLLFERFRGQISLASYKRELAAKGEKLTPQELSVSVPVAKNGAVPFQQATQAITNGVVLPGHYPPKMWILPSGRALIGYQESEWVEDKATNHWEQVGLDLQTNAEAFAGIRAALEMPQFNNNLDYAQGVSLLLPHLIGAKSLCAWFGPESQLAIRQGQNDDARMSLIAQARLPQAMAEDRLLISELVRIAIATFAKSSLWEALQSNVLTEDDLLAIQRTWEALTFAENMTRSLEGDRIYSDVSYDLLRGSNEQTVYALTGLEKVFPVEDADRPWWERNLRLLPFGSAVGDFIKQQFYYRIWRFAWSHQAQRQGMSQLQRLTEITRIGVSNKSFADLRIAVEELEAEEDRGRLYDRLRYPFHNPVFTLSSSVKKTMQAETERSISLCAIALKRYFLRHGEYPATLAALVPEFLPVVPTDFMDGNPAKYRLRSDGGFMLYSAGADGNDDGGDASLSPDKWNLRNLWDRKDFVWPLPATPEEVEVYRQGTGRD